MMLLRLPPMMLLCAAAMQGDTTASGSDGSRTARPMHGHFAEVATSP
jgi:hypothetical protein